MIAKSKLLFYAVFVVTAFASLAMAAKWNHREISSIMLMIPLIWAFITLSPRGMILSGSVVIILRFAVEAFQSLGAAGRVDWALTFTEPLSPIALYLALGVAFYEYRRRQRVLVAKLIEAGTVEAGDRLASSLTHDFNNILTVVIGSSELLLRDKSLEPSVRKDIQTIHDAGQQGKALVQQMRAATRGSGGSVTNEDLDDLVNRQMDLVERMLPSNIHVVRHRSGHLPVKADKSQILRVLMNLCANARDAMPNGGVLTVHTGRREIDGRHMAALVVGDTGPGVDPSVIGKIFDPFFSTKADGSVGLGLSIIRSIAAAHGGKAEVDNTPGSGASFMFAIPIAAGKAGETTT